MYENHNLVGSPISTLYIEDWYTAVWGVLGAALFVGNLQTNAYYCALSSWCPYLHVALQALPPFFFQELTLHVHVLQ